MLLTWPMTVGARARLGGLLNDGNTAADWRADLGVTGALNASAIANQIGAAGPQLQATGANQPIYIGYAGHKFGYFPGIVGNRITTPDTAASRPTGDFQVDFHIAADDYTPAALNVIHVNGDNTVTSTTNWIISIDTNGTLRINRPTGATSRIYSSSVPTGFADASELYGRVIWQQNASGSSQVTYLTSPDGVTYTQLGTVVTNANTSAGNSNVNGTTIGQNNTAALPFFGKIYSVTVRNGVGGSVVQSYNAEDSIETFTNGATLVSSVTGETYTLANTAIANPASIIASPFIVTNGVAHLMQAAYAANQPRSIDLVVMPPMWTIGKYVLDGTTANTLGLAKTTSTPRLSINAGSAVAENAGATLRAKHVVQIILNGASSSIRVDGGVATTGNAGAGNPGGITIGADGGGLNFGAMWYQEIIDRAVADTAAAQDARYALLKAIWGTA